MEYLWVVQSDVLIYEQRRHSTNQPISSPFCNIPFIFTFVSSVSSWREQGPKGDPVECIQMMELQLQHLSTLMGLLWQPELSNGEIRYLHDLIRNDMGEKKRAIVVTAAGTPCLAPAGWRHSSGGRVPAVKRNSIYLPTNYRISFRHYPARTYSLVLTGPWLITVCFFLFSLPH